MNSIKTLIVATVLASVAYGVYVSLNKAPAPPPPEGVVEVATGEPVVELSSPADAPVATELAVTTDAPAYASTAPTGEAQPAPTAEAAAAYPTDAPAYEAPASYVEQQPAAPQDPAAYAPAEPSAQETQAPPLAGPADGYAPAATTDPAAAANDFQAVISGVQALLDAGQYAEAQLELSGWFEEPTFSPEQQQQVLALLDQLTGTVIYSREHYLEPAYVIQPGDTLERIAERYQVPWQLLAKINGIYDGNQLRANEQIKVLRGPFDAFVELEKHRLTLWLNGRYAGRFPIGVGKEQSTPADQDFRIEEKLENPTYYGPDQTIAADDPQNPLGERWLGLGNHLGIHGTNDVASIGRDESRGCIRLTPRDAEDVYDILSVGSRVRIQR